MSKDDKEEKKSKKAEEAESDDDDDEDEDDDDDDEDTDDDDDDDEDEDDDEDDDDEKVKEEKPPKAKAEKSKPKDDDSDDDEDDDDDDEDEDDDDEDEKPKAKADPKPEKAEKVKKGKDKAKKAEKAEEPEKAPKPKAPADVDELLATVETDPTVAIVALKRIFKLCQRTLGIKFRTSRKSTDWKTNPDKWGKLSEDGSYQQSIKFGGEAHKIRVAKGDEDGTFAVTVKGPTIDLSINGNVEKVKAKLPKRAPSKFRPILTKWIAIGIRKLGSEW